MPNVTNNEVNFNYQCGVCGKLFEEHIDEIIKRLKEDSARDKVNVAVKINATITNQETKRECNSEFETVGNKICKYFIRMS